ncbi:MAG: phosphatidate cytidylyltransferase [Desulfarculus sp.]|nr:phosphatidate cytidylyltransferase [Desulfarculus sp.]
MVEINGRRVMQGLGLRVITGLGLAVAALLLVLFAPAWLLALLVAGLAGLGMREYLRLSCPELVGPRGWLLWLLAAAIPTAGLLGAGALAGALLLGLVLAAFLAMTGGGAVDAIQRRALNLGWGLAYCSGLLSCYLLLANLDQGRVLILYGVASVVAADTGAYFAGNLAGKHRLAPTLSPGKTWEGVIGGLIFTAVIGGLFAFLFLPDTRVLVGAGLSLALGAISVVGDLLESTLKRAVGAKDSGTLLPGHGGLLDRLDGIIAAAPLLLLAREIWWA